MSVSDRYNDVQQEISASLQGWRQSQIFRVSAIVAIVWIHFVVLLLVEIQRFAAEISTLSLIVPGS